MTIDNGFGSMRTVAEDLTTQGVVGVMIVWADNNGIPRSRIVPVGRLESVAERGIGITPLFAVFDSIDGITFGHKGLSTPSGDIRLVPEGDRVVRLAGQPGLAWVPGRQVAADGCAWPYDQRGTWAPLRWAAVEAGRWARVRPGRRSYCDATRARGSGWRWGPPTGTVDCCREHAGQTLKPCGPSGRA
jgi:hypothetical protein